MDGGRRILAIGGHEFNQRSGNGAICDLIVELSGEPRPKICLLPTASGDPMDQIASFRRAFGERGCDPSAISLFRLGRDPVDVAEALLGQDVIYVGGGSMLNLVAIWGAHGLDELLRECWRKGILICGQSAGAMCWFEQGVTSSSGVPRAAPGFGVVPGSATVHYLSEPERRAFALRAVEQGSLEPGLGLEDQTAVLFTEGEPTDFVSAREGAAVWMLSPGEDGCEERRLDCRLVEDRLPSLETAQPEILELREILAARSQAHRPRRSRLGRLD